MIPTGNTTEIAHNYYNYLWSQYLSSIPPTRVTLLWSGIYYEIVFFVVLIIFFYLYAKFGTHVHRKKGEMYGVMSFAGSILERIGPLSWFDAFIWIVLTLWAIYYIVWGILYSYLYLNPVHG